MSISGKSLYIHIPFCKKKCPYCHFYSVFPRNDSLVKSFIDALILEIKRASINSSITSVYFGGGTPSLIGPEHISCILKNIPYLKSSCAEITLETNPGTVDEKKLKEFLQAGVNRLSIGIQSFNENELKFLTRIYGK